MRMFSRNYNQRKALFKSLLQSLIEDGKLTTTVAKAKAVKPLFDKMVTKAKKSSVAARRQLAASLSSVNHANRLVDVIAPLVSDRNSGYTTFAKVGSRKGDNVVLATLKLVKEIPAPVVAKEDKKAEPKAKVTKTAKKETK